MSGRRAVSSLPSEMTRFLKLLDPLTIRSAASLRLRPRAEPVQLLASPQSTFPG